MDRLPGTRQQSRSEPARQRGNYKPPVILCLVFCCRALLVVASDAKRATGHGDLDQLDAGVSGEGIVHVMA